MEGKRESAKDGKRVREREKGRGGSLVESRKDSKRKIYRPSSSFAWMENSAQYVWCSCSIVVGKERYPDKMESQTQRETSYYLTISIQIGIYSWKWTNPRTKKAFISIGALLKAFVSCPCPFYLLGISQTKDCGGYSQIKNRDYAQIHFGIA